MGLQRQEGIVVAYLNSVIPQQFKPEDNPVMKIYGDTQTLIPGVTV